MEILSVKDLDVRQGRQRGLSQFDFQRHELIRRKSPHGRSKDILQRVAWRLCACL
jgi:hypothetical protein